MRYEPPYSQPESQQLSDRGAHVRARDLQNGEDGIRTHGTLRFTGFQDRGADCGNGCNCKHLGETAPTAWADLLAFLERERPELAEVVRAWDGLPAAIKSGVAALVRTAMQGA